jgi:hypothetical protein
MNGKVLLKLCSGLHRHRAFFDDQSVSGCIFCDRSRDCFDGGKVSVAVRQRRGSYTNKDCVSPGDCLRGGTESKSARLEPGLDHILQVGLKQWHFIILQFPELFEVVLTAEYFVSNLREARRGGETHISGANH